MKFKIEKMMCSGCVSNIKARLEALDTVESAEVDLDSGTAVAEGAIDASLVVDILTEAGYPTQLIGA